MSSNYEKLQLLGTGSFGKVHLARNNHTKKLFVVKEVETKGFTASEREMALNEVAILGRCRHVNIVRYREAFVISSVLNIVMDYAENGDLQQKVEQAKWTYINNETIVDWFVQISFALRHIHGLNILHRDLKTKNIFLTKKNTIKVGDFGIARMLSSTDAHALTTVGTPYYISPEICQRLPYNHKSDMWSLGCVLYELCCLQHPFEASDLASLVVKILDGRYKAIPKHCGALLEDLVSVLLRADAATRPSADQVLCVPALRPYIQSYVRRMTGDKGLPGTPRPQGERASVDISPLALPDMAGAPDEGVVSSDPSDDEQELEHSTPESPSNGKIKYQPKNPSPLTKQPNDRSGCKQPVIRQRGLRHGNLPDTQEATKKRVPPAKSGKENYKNKPHAVLAGRCYKMKSLTPPARSHILVEKQRKVIRSAEIVRQAKLTARGRNSPRNSLYKEVLLKGASIPPLMSLFLDITKQQKVKQLANPPLCVNSGQVIVPRAQPTSKTSSKAEILPNTPISPKTDQPTEEDAKKTPLKEFFGDLLRQQKVKQLGSPSHANSGQGCESSPKVEVVVIDHSANSTVPPNPENLPKANTFTVLPDPPPECQGTLEKEVTALLVRSVCMEQGEAFSKMEALREFLERKLTSETIAHMRDSIQSVIEKGGDTTSLENPSMKPFIPLIVQLIQIEAIAGL